MFVKSLPDEYCDLVCTQCGARNAYRATKAWDENKTAGGLIAQLLVGGLPFAWMTNLRGYEVTCSRCGSKALRWETTLAGKAREAYYRSLPAPPFECCGCGCTVWLVALAVLALAIGLWFYNLVTMPTSP